MLSWCCGMVESLVICGCYKYTLLASTKFNLTVPLVENASVSVSYDGGVLNNTSLALHRVFDSVYDVVRGGSSDLPSRRSGGYDFDRQAFNEIEPVEARQGQRVRNDYSRGDTMKRATGREIVI